MHESLAPGGLLLSGPKGSGKTTTLRALSALLQLSPECLTATIWVACRSLAGETVVTLQQRLLQKVSPLLQQQLQDSSRPLLTQ